MNKDFRLALLRNVEDATPARVIDFTRYDLTAEEPSDMTRRWMRISVGFGHSNRDDIGHLFRNLVGQ
jgi:hypothetical protein